MMNQLPGDPVLCLSVVNTKLRDFYPSLDALCMDLNIEKTSLTEKLERINYRYDASRNQFI